jgi:hypothetical protein
MEPADAEGEDRKAGVFGNFVVRGPVFEESNGKQGIGDMSAESGDETEEKFEGRRTKFFRDVLKDRRNPVGDGIEEEKLHRENLLKERYKSFKRVRYANSRH